MCICKLWLLFYVLHSQLSKYSLMSKLNRTPTQTLILPLLCLLGGCVAGSSRGLRLERHCGHAHCWRNCRPRKKRLLRPSDWSRIRTSGWLPRWVTTLCHGCCTETSSSAGHFNTSWIAAELGSKSIIVNVQIARWTSKYRRFQGSWFSVIPNTYIRQIHNKKLQSKLFSRSQFVTRTAFYERDEAAAMLERCLAVALLKRQRRALSVLQRFCSCRLNLVIFKPCTSPSVDKRHSLCFWQIYYSKTNTHTHGLSVLLPYMACWATTASLAI